MKAKPLTAAVVPPSRRLQRGQRSVLWLLPVLGVAVVLGLRALASGPGDDGAELARNAPALPVPVRHCTADVDAAQDRADAAERSARDKMARYMFVPSAGLAALELLGEARACAQSVSDDALALRAAATAQRFRDRVDREYHDRITRIRRARLSGRNAQALRDVRFLLALFAEHDGPFLAELRRVRLELEAAIAAEQAS